MTDLHPTPEMLDSLAAEPTSPADLIALRNHILWCNSCRQTLREMNNLRRLMERLADAAEPES